MDFHVYPLPGGANALCAPEYTTLATSDWPEPGSPLLPLLTDDGSTSPDSFIEASLSSVSPADTNFNLGVSFYSEVPNDVVDLIMDYSESKYPEEVFQQLDSFPVPNIRREPTVEDDVQNTEELANPQVLRRRVTNREASFRYRQKLKQKTSQLQEELNNAFAAYQRAKAAYEKTEQTFEVTEKLIRGLLKLHD
ncbi:unnamed protein product [Echinostoma caproni]|uniref:BZIP domain-containing protein n=1 Tax=Echinostoma caproni TaxID=27848 RepID=A0A183BCS4_9TREM|nr:unnamed protein product [Echinostoma caproni]